MPQNQAVGKIKHIFVLMLENRSFDHMLGFSNITGTDAETGGSAEINVPNSTDSNSSAGVTYNPTTPADYVMPVDPAHEFTNVLTQLCGQGATYPPGGAYPAVNCGGFVADYASIGGSANPGEIMKCYEAAQLPVLNALAQEFVICDNWHASMPGPTWPNRMFLHAASSGGLDHSPSTAEILEWETLSGFEFEKGTIFDSLNRLNHGWRLYAGGDFPQVAALKGVNNFEIHDMDDFAADIAAADYPVLYTFIEPNYGDVVSNTYQGGNSQHPLDDVRHGEALIKSVYEAIRRSSIWASSMLIVTWDEHGGFYDHVLPPDAIPPGDQIKTDGVNAFGFNFSQYGPRVPAVVISPLIPRNLIDHRVYDHSSVPATIEAVFGLQPLTHRDASARNLTSLASLATPRTDAPMTLPGPATAAPLVARAVAAPMPGASAAPVDQGNLPGFLHSALRTDLALSPPEQRPAIIANFDAINTRGQAQQYMDGVRVKLQAARAATKVTAARNSQSP